MDTPAQTQEATQMTDDNDIHTRINALVEEEHQLTGRPDAAERRKQLVSRAANSLRKL